MKKANRLLGLALVGYLLLIFVANIAVMAGMPRQGEREYRVSVNRLGQAIASYEEEFGEVPGSLKDVLEYKGVSGYPGIERLYVLKTNMDKDSGTDIEKQSLQQLLAQGDEDYQLVVTELACYKIAYSASKESHRNIYLVVNGVLLVSGVFLTGILCYVRGRILKPFHQLSELPYELSKGNLTVPVKENKNRFFGRFLWGMDVLRERLEESRAREYELQKEKKLLLLSLSHDIKTPLSAIKLYAKAISKNLYKSDDKKQEIAENISGKVDEIEGFLSQIVTASQEDFLHFDVENGEFYIRGVIEQIQSYYTEKMELNQIVFEVGAYTNCLVYGDDNRLVEVLQNIIENAIKYGDGKKIGLSFEKNSEAFEISVRNTGKPLDEKELPHIFDSFFRGSNVGKKQGSGLGLYICRCLMHQMEGEIYVQYAENEMIIKVVVHLV